MANLAYQVTGFAYQGAGQFAYQGAADAPPAGVSAGGSFPDRRWRSDDEARAQRGESFAAQQARLAARIDAERRALGILPPEAAAEANRALETVAFLDAAGETAAEKMLARLEARERYLSAYLALVDEIERNAMRERAAALWAAELTYRKRARAAAVLLLLAN